MTKIILLIALLLFSGCQEAMTAKQINKAIKECEDHNLTYWRLSSMYVDGGFSTTKIRCGGRKGD